MKPPLKLNEIDKEHLQELYDAAGVGREHLPYTPVFEKMCQDFQDRTFKNADPEQVYGALLKYIRSGNHPAPPKAESKLNEEQFKQLKAILPRHSSGGKILPYSDEVEAARKEFSKLSGVELTAEEFWQAIVQMQTAKRRPPPRRKAAAPVEPDSDDDADV
jgi:hypothetical protein